MPNVFAYFMLLFWPVVATLLFRRLPIERAFIWSILAAYLVLPPKANFDYPLLPPFDKTLIPSIVAVVLAVAVYKVKFRLPESGLVRLLMFLYVFGPVVTTYNNQDFFPFEEGGGVPSMSITDVFGQVFMQATALVPFLLGARLLATEEAQRDLLWALMVGLLAYSLPMLVEVRMSPQINVWIYGFFQHDFAQMMREGGFRPVVFLPHGLWMAILTVGAVMAAAGLWRAATGQTKAFLSYATAYLGVILVLCKSYAALLYGLAFVPVILYLHQRVQVSIAAALVLLAFSYPLLRSADLVPVRPLVEQVQTINKERAQSLEFRLDNEDALIEHAYERPLFGWGSWGRHLTFDEVTGKQLTVADGRWIITLGVYGYIGYLAEFGLLALAVLRIWRRAGVEGFLSPYSGPLALILAVNMFDMLPNATLTPVTWMIAGALTGYAERSAVRRESQVPTGAVWSPGSSLAAAAVPLPQGRPRRVN